MEDLAARRTYVVLAAIVLLEVAYILSFERFVTIDAAAHIGTAAHLIGEVTGSGPDSSRLLETNLAPSPNLLPGLALAGLVWLFGIGWAEKILLLGYVVALPAATVFALRSAGRHSADLLAFFALPLTFSFTFLYGFLNYSYSVVLFLVAAGLVVRSGPAPTRRLSLLLSGLLLVTFFAHLVGFLEASLLLLIVAACHVAFARRSLVAQLRHVAIALLPAAGLTLWFVVTSQSAGVTVWGSPPRKLAGVISLEWALASYDRAEWIFCVLAAGALWLLGLLAIRRPRLAAVGDPVSAALIGFVMLGTAVALFSPEEVESGGSYLSQRLALFPALGGLLWLARMPIPRRAVLAAAGAAIVAAAGLAAVRHDELRDVQQIALDVDPLVACVAERSTVLQANVAYPSIGSLGRILPLGSETGRVTARREGLDLGNIDWGVPFSLFRYRPEADPFVHLADPGAPPDPRGLLDRAPPPLDFDRFERETGIPVDAVLVFGRRAATGEALASGVYEGFNRRLRQRFVRTAVSPDRWWELWVHPGAESERPCVV